MSPQKLSSLQQSAVALNKKGLISLNQIDGSEGLNVDISNIKEQLSNLDPSQFRKISSYILEQDLDPSLKEKLKVLTEQYDTVLDTISGIEYNGKKYDISDILITVLQNINKWNDASLEREDLYTTVERL